MNTDNTSISGETIDYGPCAFLEAYDPDKVFSSIDQQGRYAYRNQPIAANWNLTRLAEAMLPILEQEEGGEEAALVSANESVATFEPLFHAAYAEAFRRKLGFSVERDGDTALANDLLARMAANQADFTLTFRKLCQAAEDAAADREVRALFADPMAYDTWVPQWRQRLSQESATPQAIGARMRQVNPAIIPRNHYVQEVIDAAIEREDFQPFEDLLAASARPYGDIPAFDRYTAPARPEQCIRQTFCGT
jgi:uncharacterized protein YdiU (UPF0061 family)